MAPDLTRADAREAIAEAKGALAALNHLAIAGMLHANGQPGLAPRLTRLMAANNVAAELIDQLGQAALRLPEEAPDA